MDLSRRVGVRLLGAALVTVAVVPIFRAMPVDPEAPVRAAVLTQASFTLQYALWGTIVVLVTAYLLARIAPDIPRTVGAHLGRWLVQTRATTFAGLAGMLAFTAALGVSHILFDGLFTNVDEMASLIHARYLATGMLAGPAPELAEAWLIPNTLIVARGWVSQYPPSHPLAMAAFVAAGAPALVGPVLLGGMAALTAMALERLLPGRLAEARTAALLSAVSPLMVLLGGGALSHLTAGAALAGALWAALRARDGNACWALLTGASIGIAVMARPLVGLLLGTVFTLGVWAPAAWRHWGGGGAAGPGPDRVAAAPWLWGLRRAGWTVLGGLPFAALLGAYHARLFGGPTRWGYIEAFGKGHGLGFHSDPWGYVYGPLEAMALTSADLTAVGVHLLETPVPLTLVIGVWFLVQRTTLPEGSGFLAAWALLPVLGNAAYWFHADRMYFEAAPAWITLAVLAAVKLSGGTPPTAPSPRGPWPRTGAWAGWATLLSLALAVAWGAPTRWQAHAWDEETLGRIGIPDVPGDGPAVVFVHTAWNERTSATLQGAGSMRQDTVTAALRRNDACTLHRYARVREAVIRDGAAHLTLPDVDLTGAPGSPAGLVARQVGPGPAIRVREGADFPEDCLREVRADRFGTVALAPLLWQGDLPGDARGRPMFVRDLGPNKNDRIRAAFPDHTPWVFTPTEPGAPPVVVPYADAMELLWGTGEPSLNR